MLTGSAWDLSYKNLFDSFQQEVYKCSLCKELYDLELRIPRILPCQHLLCQACIKDSLLMMPLLEPQCPNCRVSFSSTRLPPEAFATNDSLFEILRKKAKTNHGYCHEHACSKNLFCMTDQIPICKYCCEYGNHKGHCVQPIKVLQDKASKKKTHLKMLLQENVKKKQKAELEIKDKLTEIQELITDQFFEMRKMLHLKQAEISQAVDTAVKAESENLMNAFCQNKTILESKLIEKSQGYDFTTTDNDGCEDHFSFAEISKQVGGILAETQVTLSRFLKTIGSLKLEPQQINEVSTQTAEETILQRLSEENQEPTILQEEALIQMESDAFNVFQDQNDEVFNPQPAACDEIEEEFEEVNNGDEEEKQEIEEMKNYIVEIETESHLKLDFTDKFPSDDFSTILCSEEIWNRTDKKKICHLELNFSGTSLTDQQFMDFILNVMLHMENLTSVIIDLAQTKVSFESLQVFSQVLKNYKLKRFVLNCSHTSIGREGMNSLEDGLGSLAQTLETVEIILDSTDIQGEKFLDALMGMNQLKHLKLSFENSQISSEIVSSVVFCLRFLAQNLETLDLNFNGTKIQNQGLESFLNHVIFYLEKLKRFKLGLAESLISDDLLLAFFDRLSLLAPRLATFELDLHSTGLTNTTFKYFCDGALNKMVNLEKLNLDLSQTKIEGMSLKSMRLPVRKLKSVTLNLNKTNLSDSSLKSFKENNNFKNIETRDFQFEQAHISDKALQDFFKNLIKERENSRDLRFNSTLKKIPSKSNPKTRNIPAFSKASSEYSSDAENHPDLNDDFKPQNSMIQLDISTKRKILLELKKALLIEHGHPPDPTLDLSKLLGLIQNLEVQKYTRILRQVLTKNLPDPNSIPEDLNEWRKKIQIWTEEFSNDCFKRHSSEVVFSKLWLRAYARKISFQEKVIEILQEMSTRSLPIFGERILGFVKELSSEYKSWKIPSRSNFYWWYAFMSKEKEIASIWKSLPRPHQFFKEEYDEER